MPTPTIPPVDAVHIERGFVIGETLEESVVLDGVASMRYIFFAEAGAIVTVYLTTGNPQGFAINYLVTSVDGSLLHPAAQEGNYRVFILPQTGRYSITINPSEYAHVTSLLEFTLRVSESPAVPLEPDQPQTIIPDADTGMTRFTISGQIGDRRVVFVESPDVHPHIRLFVRETSEAQAHDITMRLTHQRGRVYVPPFTLEAGRAYSLGVLYGTADTEFTVTLDAVDPLPLAYGDEAESALDGSQRGNYYTFQGEYGDFVDVRVLSDEGDDLDAVLVVYSPDGRVVGFDDDGGPGLDPEIRGLLLNMSGEYTISVQGSRPAETGAYTLRLDRNETYTLTEDAPRTVYLDKAPAETLVFSGQAGEDVRIAVRRIEGRWSPRVTVVQQGRELFSLPESDVQRLEYGFTVPSDGQLLVRFERVHFSAQGTGPVLVVSLERLNFAD
jgi:hypothetical protein